MTDHHYPIPATGAPFLINLGTYVAIYLEEAGFPPVTGQDQQRLDAALNEFLYQQPAKVMPS